MRRDEISKLRALQWELAEHSAPLARVIGATLKNLLDSFTVETQPTCCSCDDIGESPCELHGYGELECDCHVRFRAPLYPKSFMAIQCPSCFQRYAGVEDERGQGSWKKIDEEMYQACQKPLREHFERLVSYPIKPSRIYMEAELFKEFCEQLPKDGGHVGPPEYTAEYADKDSNVVVLRKIKEGDEHG